MMKKINEVNTGPNFVGPAVTCQNDYEKENQCPLTSKYKNLNKKTTAINVVLLTP